MFKRISAAALTLALSLIMILSLSAAAFAYSSYCPESYDGDHSWAPLENAKVIRMATPKKKGIAEKDCMLCGEVKRVKYKWSYEALDVDTGLYKSYDVIRHTPIYYYSDKVKIKLNNALKGSIVKIKIGKKTYKKKVGKKKNLTIKIKSPKMGSKVSIKVYYKGKVIGHSYTDYEYDEDEIVYYGKKIKIGQTKKQVKCLSNWGRPDDTGSSSGGWSYWYYDDGSYVAFRYGRVNSWYYTD